jgi:2-hydroxy-3-keto-5-methylthiopentenyl-1-phosphate phosphatase
MMKTLIQSDFDGTITEEDISFFLLDAFAQGDWRRWLREYKEQRISVGEFSTRAFAMVKVDKHTLIEALKGRVKVRAGFRELVNYCLNKGLRLVIVSNGVDFYIRAVLEDMGLTDLEVHAAQASFHPEGMRVLYVGPDGKTLKDGFKETYAREFLKLGYKLIYIGNGDSDVAPAKHAHHLFATGDLLAYCKENKMKAGSFETFLDVIRELDLMQPCCSSACDSRRP